MNGVTAMIGSLFTFGLGHIESETLYKYQIVSHKSSNKLAALRGTTLEYSNTLAEGVTLLEKPVHQ